MSYISKGDLIDVRWWSAEVNKWGWKKAVALTDDYVRRSPGTGEFVNDFTFIPSIDYVFPDTGVKGVARLSEVKKL